MSVAARSLVHDDALIMPEASASAISWAAVIGGAFVTAAVTLILLALGAGAGEAHREPGVGGGGRAPGA